MAKTESQKFSSLLVDEPEDPKKQRSAEDSVGAWWDELSRQERERILKEIAVERKIGGHISWTVNQSWLAFEYLSEYMQGYITQKRN